MTCDTRTTNREPIALELSDSDGEVDEVFLEDDMRVADTRECDGSRVRSTIRLCIDNTLDPPIARKLRTKGEQYVNACLAPKD